VAGGKRVKDFAIDIGHPTVAPAPEAPPLAAPIRATLAPVATGKWVRTVALGLAVMAHAAVLYALSRERDAAGGGGQLIDTISVTIVTSNLLDARQADLAQPNAPAVSNAVEATDGIPDQEAKTAAERREEKKAEEEPRDKKPLEEPVRTAEAIFEVPKEAQRQRKQEAATPAGGGAALTDAPTNANTSAPVAASAGAVREYGRNVVEVLRKTKPKAVGEFGTVRVKFTITADGGVVSAEIAKSSGNKKLDNLALEAVQRTKFRTPPAGMTSTQLFYELPYYFR
jgi:TonB family protein